jgi:hypothetical protein
MLFTSPPSPSSLIAPHADAASHKADKVDLNNILLTVEVLFKSMAGTKKGNKKGKTRILVKEVL